jgi:hypothetical protein
MKMNSVTKKLIELAGAIPDSSGKWIPAESVEKLTKLMVEEFHAYVTTYYDPSEPWITPDSILKHFGMNK